MYNADDKEDTSLHTSIYSNMWTMLNMDRITLVPGTVDWTAYTTYTYMYM